MVYEEDKLKMSYPNATYLNQISELKQKIESQRKEIESWKKAEEEDHDHGPAFDYYRDVRRFERHCKMLDKKIKACRDDDKMIRLLNCLGFIQGKKKEYADVCLDVKRILKERK